MLLNGILFFDNQFLLNRHCGKNVDGTYFDDTYNSFIY